MRLRLLRQLFILKGHKLRKMTIVHVAQSISKACVSHTICAQGHCFRGTSLPAPQSYRIHLAHLVKIRPLTQAKSRKRIGSDLVMTGKHQALGLQAPRFRLGGEGYCPEIRSSHLILGRLYIHIDRKVCLIAFTVLWELCRGPVPKTSPAVSRPPTQGSL